MRLRSLLFVPGDRPERFDKALHSGADAIILDLEDSVSPVRKEVAREAVARYLDSEIAHESQVFVRINPLHDQAVMDDLHASRRAFGIVLPKAEGASSLRRLDDLLGNSPAKILLIATETPAAVFHLGGYAGVSKRLCGLTWGAEDLPTAIGASTSREADGRYTPPYEMVRALTLFGAHAAGVPAIDTVYPGLNDATGLTAYATRAMRDGFGGMLAVHPKQVNIINRAFTPTDDDLARARRIVEAFRLYPGSGVLEVDGHMVDAPHMKQALRLLAMMEGA